MLLSMAAVETLNAGKSVAFFSLEMPDVDILLRMASNIMGRPMRRVSELQTPQDRKAIEEASQILRNFKLTLTCDVSDINDICFRAAKLAAKGMADLVIVDYLQICEVQDGGDNREQAVATISRRLKNLASTSNLAGFSASQLNDEGRLRESRAIGQNANAVLSIDTADSRTFITILKNRRGPKGARQEVRLRGELGRFEQL